MKKFKKIAAIQLVILVMGMSAACASQSMEEISEESTQTTEVAEQVQQETVEENTAVAVATDVTTTEDQVEEDSRFDVDTWVEILDELIPANGKKYDFMCGKWGDSKDEVKKAMGRKPDGTMGEDCLGYDYPLFDYKTIFHLLITNCEINSREQITL